MQSYVWNAGGPAPFGGLGAARILLASDVLPVRLTLQSLLERSGYLVQTAVSPTDAMEKVEAAAYDLILCATSDEDHEACRPLLELARAQDHRPATATLTVAAELAEDHGDEMFIEPVDVPVLLTQITELLAGRAYGRSTAASARRAGGAAA